MPIEFALDPKIPVTRESFQSWKKALKIANIPYLLTRAKNGEMVLAVSSFHYPRLMEPNLEVGIMLIDKPNLEEIELGILKFTLNKLHSWANEIPNMDEIDWLPSQDIYDNYEILDPESF